MIWDISIALQILSTIKDTLVKPSGYAFIDFYLPDQNCFIEYNGKQHMDS